MATSTSSPATPLLPAAATSGDTTGNEDTGSSSRRAYFLFLGMGLATLLPWNLFISASEFYQYQFAGSTHQQTFQNSFSVTYMVTNLAFNIYAMLTVTKTSPNARILYGLVANTLAYIVGVFMPLMGDYRGSLSFYIAISQLAVTAAASGLLTNSTFALVAHFPPSHAEGVLSGQAVAGIIAAAAQLATAYSVSPVGSAQGSARLARGPAVAEGGSGGLIPRTIAYFAFATVTNVALTVAFLYVKHDPYYAQKSKLACPAHDQVEGGNRSEAGDSQPILSEATTSAPAFSLDTGVLRSTFSQISGYSYVILLDFALTLAVFPSVTALVTSTTGFRLLTEWHFFIFNVGDFLGRRFAPSLPISSIPSLLGIAFSRFLFIPVFFLCHVSFSVWYNWITSDLSFLVLVLLLGATNGYLSTRSAMIAPALSDHPTIAGTIVAISISTGLAIGSIFSWPVRAAGCLCSPF